MKNTGTVIASLIGGMLVGSALAMLMTPQSGPELRRRIKDAIDEGVRKAKNKAAELENEYDEHRCNCEK